MKATLPDCGCIQILSLILSNPLVQCTRKWLCFFHSNSSGNNYCSFLSSSFRDNWKVSVSVGTFKAAVDLLSLTAGINALVYKGTNLKSNQMDIYCDSSLCKDKHAEKLSFSHVGPDDLWKQSQVRDHTASKGRELWFWPRFVWAKFVFPLIFETKLCPKDLLWNDLDTQMFIIGSMLSFSVFMLLCVQIYYTCLIFHLVSSGTLHEKILDCIQKRNEVPLCFKTSKQLKFQLRSLYLIAI